MSHQMLGRRITKGVLQVNILIASLACMPHEAKCNQNSPEVHVFFSPANGGTEHVIGVDSATNPGKAQLLSYMCNKSKCWTGGTHCPGNLTINFSNMLAYYVPGDNTDHVIVSDSQGNIEDINWSEGSSGADCGSASATEVTDFNLLNTAGDTLAGFVDTNNIAHVFFVADTGVLAEAYRLNGTWFEGFPPTPPPGLPPRATKAITQGRDLTAIWDGSANNIFVTGADGNLWDVYFNGTWSTLQLSGSAGLITPPIGSGLSPGNFMSAVDYMGTVPLLWGAQSNNAGALSVVARFGSAWESEQISAFNLAFSNTPVVVLADDGYPYYIGEGAGGGAIFDVQAGSEANLQQKFGGSFAANSSIWALTGGVDTSGTDHLFYIGTDNFIHEYYGTNDDWLPNTIETTHQFQ
jgi:hypothetical protein